MTLGHVLVGALNPGGCSHTQLFVVFVLHREAGYFPEPGRRISVAWPPSPAAHMTSTAGKPRMTAPEKEVHEGWRELRETKKHQLSLVCQVNLSLNEAQTLFRKANTASLSQVIQFD